MFILVFILRLELAPVVPLELELLLAALAERESIAATLIPRQLADYLAVVALHSVQPAPRPMELPLNSLQ